MIFGKISQMRLVAFALIGIGLLLVAAGVECVRLVAAAF